MIRKLRDERDRAEQAKASLTAHLEHARQQISKLEEKEFALLLVDKENVRLKRDLEDVSKQVRALLEVNTSLQTGAPVPQHAQPRSDEPLDAQQVLSCS